MTISIQPNRVTLLMLVIIGILTFLHVSQLSIYYKVGDEEIFDFIDMLDFDIEANLPSMYSTFAISFCSILLWFISLDKRQNNEKWQYHWTGLAMIFAFLALDEAVSLHEEIGDFTENFVDASGTLYFAWVVPYSILLGIFVISYFRFLINLPREFAIRFAIAGIMFVGGAVGLEILSAREADAYGTDALSYSVLYTCEELLEMISIVVFARALLLYINKHIGDITLEIGNKEKNL